MAPKIYSSSVKFKPGEIINILREVKSNPELASHEVQQFNLVGGQAYVYLYSDLEKKSDWKSDNYRFVQNSRNLITRNTNITFILTGSIHSKPSRPRPSSLKVLLEN